MAASTTHEHTDSPLAVAIDPAVLAAAAHLAAGPGRRMLGIVGAPAAGKSTLADALVATLGARAANVPMDGFHLAQRELERLGRAKRKGAPDTFDSAGYRALLARLGEPAAQQEVVYAPGFYREIEEPIAASIAVAPEVSLVITEGNYLLLDAAPWTEAAAQLDEIWYLDVETAEREAWLAARHQRHGWSEAEAWAWIAATDRPNAERIETTAYRADRHLVWDGTRIRFADADVAH